MLRRHTAGAQHFYHRKVFLEVHEKLEDELKELSRSGFLDDKVRFLQSLELDKPFL